MENTGMVTLRALAPSLTRITVAGAVGAALHIGQGNCDLIDDQAVEFSRAVLQQTDIEGEVICCEGPKDNAPSFSTEKKSARGKVQNSNSSLTPWTEPPQQQRTQRRHLRLSLRPRWMLPSAADDGYYSKSPPATTAWANSTAT